MRVISSKKRSLRTPAEQRKAKGLQLFKSDHVAIMTNDVTEFKVRSEVENAFYSVLLSDNANACTCPDYVYNHITNCKHIYAAIYARHEAGYLLKL